MVKYRNVLITGGTGKLGKAILRSSLGERKILAPTRSEMDITNRSSVQEYFSKHKIDSVIHCAAFTNMPECEKNPAAAIKTNMAGTNNLAEEAIKRNIRIVYISTDYVYPCVRGPYSESDPAIPFNNYGWSKLGGECAVKLVKNHCIIRTSFFEPEKITFDTAPSDSFCSKIPISELTEAIIFLLDSDLNGTINVGQERKSIYEIYRKYKKDIKPIDLEEINKDLPLKLKRAKDSSLNVQLWRSLKNVD